MSGFLPVTSAGKQIVVGGLSVANMGDDGQPYRRFIERFGPSGPADTSRVAKTGVFRDALVGAGWATGKQFPDPLGEFLDIVAVELAASF